MPLQRRTPKKKRSRAGTGTFYNASDIRDLFFAETSERQAQKISNDGTYWTGGRCQWGGSHNLDEDAQTLARFLNKIGELDDAKVELMDCSERSEFDLTKQKLISQCDEAINGLQVNTGYGSSIGGICIIWGDFLGFLEDAILSKFRSEFSRLRREISEVTYNESKELAKLDIEQERTELEMMENQRKANEETDPTKQAIFLELVEENKRKLQEVIKKKKKIPLNSLGRGFDISKYIEELIKNAKGNQPPNPSDPNHKKNPTNPNKKTPATPPFAYPNPDDSKTPTKQNWLQENKELVILGGVILLALLYINSQKEESEARYGY